MCVWVWSCWLGLGLGSGALEVVELRTLLFWEGGGRGGVFAAGGHPAGEVVVDVDQELASRELVASVACAFYVRLFSRFI